MDGFDSEVPIGASDANRQFKYGWLRGINRFTRSANVGLILVAALGKTTSPPRQASGGAILCSLAPGDVACLPPNARLRTQGPRLSRPYESVIGKVP